MFGQNFMEAAPARLSVGQQAYSVALSTTFTAPLDALPATLTAAEPTVTPTLTAVVATVTTAEPAETIAQPLTSVVTSNVLAQTFSVRFKHQAIRCRTAKLHRAESDRLRHAHHKPVQQE